LIVKVLFVLHAHSLAPLHRLIKGWAKGLTSHQIEVVLAVIQEEALADTQATMARTYYLKKKNGFDAGLIGRLKEIISKEGAQLVHAHDLSSVVYSTLAARMSRRRCLLTQHFRVSSRVPGWVLAFNSAIVCASQDLMDDLLRYHRINRKKLHVIYNGVDLKAIDASLNEERRRALREELGFAEDAYVIGSLARCVKEEDQGTIVKAIKKLASRELDARLLIVGDGPAKEEIVKAAGEYGVKERLTFVNINGDYAPFLSAIDCLVLTNFSEGRPLTLLEAMAARKPVVATSVGANKEVITEGKNGYLVPCGFPERIHTAVMRLNSIPELPRQIGEAGRKLVEEKFTLEGMVNSYAELYAKLI
jgi:glycosyltransferase involved in cell wall biosynthesis